MKKIDLRKYRSLAIGALVVSPALITVAYAKTCDECNNDWAVCIGNANYAQTACEAACAPEDQACHGECSNRYANAVADCDEASMACWTDCTMC
jgi:hypothetical protein